MRFSPRRLAPTAACSALSGAALLFSGGALAAGPLPDTPAGPAPQTPPDAVALESCHPSALGIDRYATFSAQMTATAKTKQMWVRFTLERLSGGAVAHAFVAPGLGVWQKSEPGVGLFRYSQQVANLPAPGSFRALVGFRWYDARHRLVKRSHRFTPVCVVPDPRPHLKVGAITPLYDPQSQTAQYAVTVRNDGASPASGVGVLLTVAGAAQPQQTIAQLAAGAEQTLSFDGPRCSAPSSLTVTLDPGGTVNQTTRADDVRTASCP